MLYIAPNCRAELSAPNCPAPNCPGTLYMHQELSMICVCVYMYFLKREVGYCLCYSQNLMSVACILNVALAIFGPAFICK